jgi:hypothetical protein
MGRETFREYPKYYIGRITVNSFLPGRFDALLRLRSEIHEGPSRLRGIHAKKVRKKFLTSDNKSAKKLETIRQFDPITICRALRFESRGRSVGPFALGAEIFGNEMDQNPPGLM